MDCFAAENISSKHWNDYVYEDTGGCISSLKHIAPGDVWPQDDIRIRKEGLLERGREWLVVDNLMVHESIKLGAETGDDFISNYQQTLINLSDSGIKVVCYNFMPVFYKVRTHYSTSCPGKHVFSLFDMVAFVAFDLYILKRNNAEQTYSAYQRHQAKCFFRTLGEDERWILTENILSAVQSNGRTTLDELRRLIEEYNSVSNAEFSRNLRVFESKVIPLADSVGLKMHLNSDNPCTNLLGLPYVS